MQPFFSTEIFEMMIAEVESIYAHASGSKLESPRLPLSALMTREQSMSVDVDTTPMYTPTPDVPSEAHDLHAGGAGPSMPIAIGSAPTHTLDPHRSGVSTFPGPHVTHGLASTVSLRPTASEPPTTPIEPVELDRMLSSSASFTSPHFLAVQSASKLWESLSKNAATPSTFVNPSTTSS